MWRKNIVKKNSDRKQNKQIRNIRNKLELAVRLPDMGTWWERKSKEEWQVAWFKKKNFWIWGLIFGYVFRLGKTRLHEFFQIYRPINGSLPPIWSFSTGASTTKSRKSIFCDNFWLECPTDLRLTCLSYIFRALFRDTPLGHVRRTLPNSQYLIFRHIWGSVIS